MAKLDTDFSAYTGPHMFYVLIPYLSETLAAGRTDDSGVPKNMNSYLNHYMLTYVVKSTDRVIGYLDKSNNICYILSNSKDDKCYDGVTHYKLNSPDCDNTMTYKAQVSIEANILSGHIQYTSGVEYPSGNRITSDVPAVDFVELDFDEPTKIDTNLYLPFATGGYFTRYPDAKVGYKVQQLLTSDKTSTQLAVHVGDGMYGTIPVGNITVNFPKTEKSEIMDDNFGAWLENVALANIATMFGAPKLPSSSRALGSNKVTDATMTDSNAFIYNLIITENYESALKFLDDGTIPPDAIVREKKATDSDDDNEPGENGSKKSTFDENEPSAPAVNSVKLSNLHNYWVTESQMQSFYDAVWNTDLTDFVKGAFTGIYENLISNVVSLKYMPTSPTNLGGTGDTSPVILGFKTYDALTVQTIGNTVAPIVDIGSYQFSREYNSFADYAPYTDIRLYLPFVGVVPLDTNLFMGAGGGTPPKLNVKAQYDLQSGLITYFIMRNKTMISSVSGRMAVEVPISLQSGMDTFTTISSNFIGKATSFVGNAMAGNPIGMVADIAQGSATAPPQTVFSSVGGDGAFYAHPKCMIMIRHPQYNRPKNYSHVVGFPAYVTKKVSDLNGFNAIKNPVIPLAYGMTSIEHDMIVSSMQKGLYY